MSTRLEVAQAEAELICCDAGLDDEEATEQVNEWFGTVRDDERDECARLLEAWTISWCEGDSPFDLIGALSKAIRNRGKR